MDECVFCDARLTGFEEHICNGCIGFMEEKGLDVTEELLKEGIDVLN